MRSSPSRETAPEWRQFEAEKKFGSYRGCPAAPFEAAAAEHRDERLAHTAGAEAAFSAPNQDAAVTGLLARAVQREMTWTEARRHGLSRAAPVAQTVHGHGEWKLCAAWLVPGGGIEEGQV